MFFYKVRHFGLLQLLQSEVKLKIGQKVKTNFKTQATVELFLGESK